MSLLTLVDAKSQSYSDLNELTGYSIKAYYIPGNEESAKVIGGLPRSKTILITGTSSGIGKATAIYFQQQGWNVIATLRSPEKESELSNLENVQIFKLDVLDLESIKFTIKYGIQKFGQIDALVNNAGYSACGTLESFPKKNILKQFNTKVIGLMDVTKAIISHLRKNQNGVIVNISSIGRQMTFALVRTITVQSLPQKIFLNHYIMK